MYLLTFVTLIIGIIGIYSQVLAVQTARIAARQTGLAQTMLTWHSAALTMAASIIDTNLAGWTAVAATGCSLSFTTPAGFAACPPPLGLATGTVTLNVGNALNSVYNKQTLKYECVPLQPVCASLNAAGCASCTTQYDVANYQFYSVVYNDAVAGHNYVVTFVPAAVISANNPAPGFIQPTSAGAQLGFTQSDLLQQMQRSNASFSYGIVAAGAAGYNLLKLAGGLLPNGQYRVPLNVPIGALAVIASPDGI